jgi:predicted MPP superfamily phosphohydrolase
MEVYRNLLLLPLLLALVAAAASAAGDERAVLEVSGSPEGVVWVVQLSDLHFSVHHPDRAYDFRRYVGPALAMVNPALVLITGDLTGTGAPLSRPLTFLCRFV